MNAIIKSTFISVMFGSALAMTGCSTTSHEDRSSSSEVPPISDNRPVASDSTPQTQSPAEPTYADTTDGEIEKPAISIDDTTVHFAFDSSQLSSEAEQVLAELASKLENVDQNVAIHLAGYADSIGSEEYNRTLSKARAESVRSYLSAKGFNNVQFQVEAYGEAQPVATNYTENGRQENRRVVVTQNESAQNQKMKNDRYSAN